MITGLTAAIAVLVTSPSMGQAAEVSTTFKVGQPCPEIVSEFGYGPWKGEARDIVKVVDKGSFVVVMANPIQADLDALAAIGDTLEASRVKYATKGLKVGIVSYHLGSPSGMGSKEWLNGQLNTLSTVLNHPELSLGTAPLLGKIFTSFKLKAGFSTATFVVKSGIVTGISNGVTGDKAGQAKLAKAIDAGLK